MANTLIIAATYLILVTLEHVLGRQTAMLINLLGSEC